MKTDLGSIFLLALQLQFFAGDDYATAGNNIAQVCDNFARRDPSEVVAAAFPNRKAPSPDEIKKLPQAERNRLALLLAPTMPQTDTRCWFEDCLLNFDWESQTRHTVTDRRVLEEVVTSMERAHGSEEIQEAVYLLSLLTWRDTFSIHADWSTEQAQPLVAWLREWWKKNRDRQPLPDPEFTAAVQHRLRQITAHLQSDLAPHYQGTHYLGAEWMFHENTGDALIAGSMSAEGAADVSPIGKHFFLDISAEFSTPLPDVWKVSRSEQDRRSRWADWRAVEVYREAIRGTDIVIKVRAAAKEVFESAKEGKGFRSRPQSVSNEFIRRVKARLATLPRSKLSERRPANTGPIDNRQP